MMIMCNNQKIIQHIVYNFGDTSLRQSAVHKNAAMQFVMLNIKLILHLENGTLSEKAHILAFSERKLSRKIKESTGKTSKWTSSWDCFAILLFPRKQITCLLLLNCYPSTDGKS